MNEAAKKAIEELKNTRNLPSASRLVVLNNSHEQFRFAITERKVSSSRILGQDPTMSRNLNIQLEK